MMYGIIYVAENTINGKKYVGQTIQPLRVRWLRHCRKEHSGCAALASAIAKYGADAFRVTEVAQASCKEELNQLEADMVVALGTLAPSDYNLRSGGGSKGRHSSGSREKMAVAHRTDENRARHAAQTKSKWQNDKYRQKMVDSAKAFWADPEKKEAASKKLREAAANPEVQRKKSEALRRYYAKPENIEKSKARASSDEAKAKISAASKQRWLDPDYRAKQEEFRRRYWTEEKRAEYGKRAQKFLTAQGLPARSGYRGVRMLKSGRFVARISFEKKEKQIGIYDTVEQAHAAYIEFKRQMVINLTRE